MKLSYFNKQNWKVAEQLDKYQSLILDAASENVKIG